MQDHQKGENDLCAITEISNVVDVISENIKKIPAESEESFLALGASARECFFSSKTLNEALVSLLKSISSESENSITSLVNEIIEVSQNAIKKTNDSHADNQKFHDLLSKGMKRLNRECYHLDSASTYFNMLSTNIKITAAGIPAARDMFSGVSDSTLQLSVDIHNASDTISSIISRFLIDHDMLSSYIERKTAALYKMSTRIIKDLKNAKYELEHLSNEAKDQLQFLNDRVQEMSALIGKIVVSVQFHDRMRQRLEHVDEAIVDAMNCVQTVDDKISKIQLFFILELQIEHLNEIVKEFLEIKELLDSTFSSLIIDVQGLQQNFSGKNKEQDIIGGLEMLNGVLKHQISIQEDAEKDSKSIQDSIVSTIKNIEEIQDFLANIDEWVFQAQFVSLNASVNASKLGIEGASLAVLSEEIVRQSEGLSKSVTKIKESIHNLDSTINAQNFETVDATKQISALYEDLTEKSLLFEAQQTKEVKEHLLSIKELLKTSQKDTHFLHGCFSSIKQTKNLIMNLKESLRPLLEEEHLDPENRSVVLKEIYNSYTMEEERQVHLKYFGSDTIDSNGTNTTEEDMVGANDDDVELFDSDDDVELFDNDDDTLKEKDSIPVDNEDVNKSEDEDFGDNVELF